MAYRDDIDGLRAVAVLAVLLFHAAPGALPGGSWGVDVFFVISGFLITSLIVRDVDAGTFSFVTFYAKRARRLLPALAVVLAACALAGWYILLPGDFRSLGTHILSGALYVSNFTLWNEVGYFDSAAKMKPLLHLWSLGVEEQFYLVWPVLLLVAFRWRGPVILAVTVASFLCAVASSPTDAFYLPWNRFWELGIGALLALYGRDLPAWWGAVGAAFLAVAFALPEGHSPWIALLPTIGAALLIATRAGWLSVAPLVGIGRISYQLYLWHWPLLVFARHWTGADLSPVMGLAVVAASFPLAVATYWFVERPIRHAPLRMAGGAAVAIAGIGAFGAFTTASAGFPSRFAAEYAAILETKSAGNAMRNQVCFLDAEQPGSELKPTCVDPGAGPLVLLWGDSHAAQLYPGLRALATERGFRIAQVTQSQCPFVPYIDFPSAPNCRSVNQAALDQIAALNPAVVIVATRWSLYPWMPDRLWKMGLEIAQSFTVSSRVIVLGSFPEWPLPLPQIIRAKLSDGSDFPQRMTPSNDPAVRDRTARLVKGFRLHFVDPFDALCDETGCITTAAAHLTVYDDSHLTAAGSTYFVRKALSSLLP
jgi:peptidoglycan/LPS O-acetylase OafA/YrhL